MSVANITEQNNVIYNSIKINSLNVANGIASTQDLYIYSNNTSNNVSANISHTNYSNTLTISFTTIMHILRYEVRVTKLNEDYGVGIGDLVMLKLNLANNTTITDSIKFVSAKSSSTTVNECVVNDNTSYRVSLYAQNYKGEWDAFELFMCLDSNNNAIQFNPDNSTSGMEVISTKTTN